MKKKYTHYKAVLLIGVLSLNILSSCISTRRELGINNVHNQHIEEDRDRGRPQQVSNFSLIKTITYSAFRSLLRVRPETWLELGVGFAAGWSLYPFVRTDKVKLQANVTTSEQFHTNVITSKYEL